MKRVLLTSGVTVLCLAACSTNVRQQGTLAELEQVQADLSEVQLEDSLERAAQSYRRYLAETSENARTPEAMRRLADLQIEQAYGVIGSGEITEMRAPETAGEAAAIVTERQPATPKRPDESDTEFENRALGREQFLAPTRDYQDELVGADGAPIPAGPREAIATYRQILEQYPDYERNDRVLYQMSRAYDEIGQPDEAMEVMNRLVREYPYSRHIDEVHFRRGEYYFVRKKYIDAEDAYSAVITLGSGSGYYELALYKKGWTLYKQYFYDEALDNFVAMLDHREDIGFDFDSLDEDEDEHRINDTFRVISLSFSNKGGPETVDEYFSKNGHRLYADKIYRNLAEFYFSKLRYDDAASVYKSFVALNPHHKQSPHFSMRVVDIYADAGFAQLVVESKRAFATNYALDADYWDYMDIEDMPEVVGFLKTNLSDLAGHYHALYQEAVLVEDKPENFLEANRWYRQLLASFPEDPDTPGVNYQLADLLLENQDFIDAANEYERTAYSYDAHEKASAAGYAAVYAYRQELTVATGARQREVMEATVDSSLRFAETFPDHEEAPVVLGAAADDLYEMKDFARAIESAHWLVGRYPASDPALRRSAWAVIAHSSIDIAEYQDAEVAYTNVLQLTPLDDESRDAVIDGLAASIYKQAEQANLLEDYRAAAGHFLRIKTVAPTSSIRSSAEYDAAAALMKIEDWSMASDVLEEFRVSHPEHELNADATKQLAYVYRQDGQTARSAAEHERIAAEATDVELSREALLTAAELYDEVDVTDDAIRVYEQYVGEYPRPLDIAMETRNRLAEIYHEQLDYQRYFDELNDMVEEDRNAGPDRSDRSRFLASRAALVLVERQFEQYARLELKQPFEDSLALKQQSMEATLQSLESLVSYEVAEVTAAATYYIAQVYLNFSASLLESERPTDLSAAEMNSYEMVIEEEAYPFEEQGIAVHEENFELLAAGVFNPWVQKSLDRLADLMPGRYAKNESSGGFVGTVEVYAYRMPIAPEPAIGEEDGVDVSQSETTSEEAAGRVVLSSVSGGAQ
ncbi:MAG: tetratricopeptide repeat protein [Gammaproteobacteria bacterium]|nr:tetratricopeptide repeat protein [Gammaproteobacteria bacterium]MDH5618441.1 tetratricopeptide repeat protein [Gammaproteobacteria bacterium]